MSFLLKKYAIVRNRIVWQREKGRGAKANWKNACEDIRVWFYVSLFDHIYWVAGCVIGSVAGNFIPISFEGIEFVLTALFVTIFVEQWLSVKDHRPAIIGVGSTLLCLLIFGKDVLLIPTMVIIALALTTLRKTGRRTEDE